MPNATAASRHLTAVPDPASPHNHTPEVARSVEQRVLGTAMESRTDLATMRDTITADSFADARHGQIWDTILAAADGGEPTDALAITERLIRTGDISRLPGAYTFELYQAAAPGQGSYWARLLAEHHTWRNITTGQARLSQALTTPGTTLDRIAELADQIAATATTPIVAASEAIAVADLAGQYVDTYVGYQPPVGMPTPWHDLNDLLAAKGLERSQLVTFGGASGMGKSVALTNCVQHLGVEAQVPTLFFTLEMTRDQVLYRILAAMTGVPELAIKRRELLDDDMARVGKAKDRLDSSPLWIVSGPRSVTQIVNEIRRHRARYGDIAAVGVDYVQIVKTDGRKENRQLEVSAIMQRLKEIALGDEVLVVTAAQINRAPAQRPDKRPTLSDLRESGEIENSSDVVVLIYRDDYYDKESPRSGEADFIVAKQRGGVTDTVTLGAQLHLTRFVSLAVA